jgi:hypothetical protein
LTGTFSAIPQLSCPANAGHPVLTGLPTTSRDPINFYGILDHPLSRMMTTA